MIVRTKMLETLFADPQSGLNHLRSVTVTPEYYAASALKTLGLTTTNAGCIGHELLYKYTSLLPASFKKYSHQQTLIDLREKFDKKD